MSVKTIYLVQGSSGEYDDHETWIVVAFTQRAPADDHAREAAAIADQIFDQYQKDPARSVLNPITNSYDPTMQMDPLTGVTYTVINTLLYDMFR